MTWAPSAETRLAGLQEAVAKYLAGNYKNPRTERHRSGKCSHGRWWFDECEQCNDEFLSAALKHSQVAPETASD